MSTVSVDPTLEWRQMVDRLRQELHDAEKEITNLRAMYVIASRRGNQFSDKINELEARIEILNGNPQCLP